jgi:hypothetical protein
MSKSAVAGREISLPQTVLQIVLTFLIFTLWSTPLVQPIKLMVVLLHEMSHGLMALASGGTVHDIVITPDEGGACRSDGGNVILIASAGYLGSMFFGGMILRAARGGSGVAVACALLALLLLGAAVTVLNDPYSRTFAFGLAGTVILLGLVAPAFIGGFVLRILGTGSCLYALFDIYTDLLIAGTPSVENDARTFSGLTGVPEDLVGLAWMAVSVLFFLAILKSSLETSGGQAEPTGTPQPKPAAT